MSFYTPIQREASPWLTGHVEFSTTMTFEHLIMALNDQFDLYDSINTGAYSVVGDLSLLTTTRDSNLVVAINEIDSDLWGPGGGSVSLLPYPAPSIVSVINDLVEFTGIESNPNEIIRDSSYSIIINGDSSDLNFEVGNDINLTAAGNINLDAGDNIVFKNEGNNKLLFDMSDPDAVKLIGYADLELSSTDDIGIYPQDNLQIGGNDQNPIVVYDFSNPTTVVQDINNNYDLNIDGTYDLQVGGDTITIRDGNNDVRMDIDMSDPLDVEMNFNYNVHFSTQGSITLQGNSTIFYDDNGNQYGAVAPTSGHLQIQTKSQPMMNFNSSGVNVLGEIRLPTSGNGAIPADFQNSLGSNVDELHHLLEALNNKIPLVYDRNGVLLNSLYVS